MPTLVAMPQARLMSSELQRKINAIEVIIFFPHGARTFQAIEIVGAGLRRTRRS
jgi:hypothetical protein